MSALSRIWQGCPSPYARAGSIWLLFFLLYNLYCYFWRHYVGGGRYDFIDSQIFWLKEWGMVLLLSGLAVTLKVRWQRSISAAHVIAAFVAMYLLSSVTRVLIDYDFFGGNWGASLVGMAPKYLLAASLVCAGLWIAARPALAQSCAPPAPDAATSMLDVEYRGLARPLPLAEVDFVKAAGNYVEIHASGKCYIKRSTIKQLTESLSSQHFMRVHRSFIVNLERVAQFCNTDTGAAYLLLAGDEKVNVSKAYKDAVKTRLSRTSIRP
ncbi:LytTR family transcriptional regulator [Microbulbifer salipaludis]|uniref:LytTR family transcriptional regulator n=1 Tax=Microbulbifer salipaludis TaxID=187980 RepID=A0ABS3E1Z8_9GAMM|nr:LytTR family transcriptional regulator DNA-binding domain-containing protein [Microbulbifer salipaludis]MBN8429319.1 LytTR family transcriptional regulator [Microbulbifer salipaludis]